MALLLKVDSVDPVVTDKDGYAALHLAAESGSLQSMKLLLEAMKSQFTTSGWSELLKEVKSIAARNHKSDLILKFIDRWDIPHEALIKGEAFPVHAAVRMADLDHLAALVKTFGVNEKDSEGETALHLAARHGLDEVTRFLLDHGANHKLSSRSGNLPLDVAVQNGHTKW